MELKHGGRRDHFRKATFDPWEAGTVLGGKVDIVAVEGRYGLQEGRNLCKLRRTQTLKFWTTALQPVPTTLPSGIACIFGLRFRLAILYLSCIGSWRSEAARFAGAATAPTASSEF